VPQNNTPIKPVKRIDYWRRLFTSNVNGVGIRSMKTYGTAYDDLCLGKIRSLLIWMIMSHAE
jgi:hypothetical protein